MHQELTKYQDAVMDLLVAGNTPKEIAFELEKSESAIRMVMMYIKRKLKSRTIAQAISVYTLARP